MKRFLSLAMLLMCICIAFVSCKEEPFSGYVVGMQHIPAHTYTRYDATTHIVHAEHTPEQWVVYVADSTRVRQFNVKKATFEKTRKGDFVTPRFHCYDTKGD